MAYYRVMLQGQGLNLRFDEDPRTFVGFFTTRIVKAASPELAAQKASDLLRKQWQAQPLAAMSSGVVPTISIESVKVATFWQWLCFKNTGHTFFPADDSDA